MLKHTDQHSLGTFTKSKSKTKSKAKTKTKTITETKTQAHLWCPNTQISTAWELQAGAENAKSTAPPEKVIC